MGSLEEFKKDLHRIAREVEEEAVNIQRAIVEYMHDLVYDLSPEPPGVGGYSTGEYRNSHKILVDGVEGGEIKIGSVVTIIPGTDHDWNVEYGEGWLVTPGYFVYTKASLRLLKIKNSDLRKWYKTSSYYKSTLRGGKNISGIDGYKKDEE